MTQPPPTAGNALVGMALRWFAAQARFVLVLLLLATGTLAWHLWSSGAARGWVALEVMVGVSLSFLFYALIRFWTYVFTQIAAGKEDRDE